MSGDAATEASIIEGLAREAAGLGVEIVDVAGNIEEISGRVEQQAHSFRGLVENAGEVNDSNRRIASAAGHAREKAAETATSVRDSENTVRSAVNDIHALVEAVSVIEGQLTGLQEALSQVSQVAQGIDAIAKQTNLLALNATIEAARAGEMGKGFAVVAGEVKELAQQTARATDQITARIGAIQASSDSAAAAIGGGRGPGVPMQAVPPNPTKSQPDLARSGSGPARAR